MTTEHRPRVLALCQRTRVVGLAVASPAGVVEVRRVTLRPNQRTTEQARLMCYTSRLAHDYGVTHVVIEPHHQLAPVAHQLPALVLPVAVPAAIAATVAGPPSLRSLAQTLIANDPKLARLVTVLSRHPLRIAETERWRTVLLYAVALAHAGLAELTRARLQS